MSTRTQSDLIKQADLFMEGFEQLPNPPPPILLDAFCEALQASGRDLGQFSELEWSRAFHRLGYPPGRGADLMEQVASWGVVNVDTWID